MTWGPLTTSSPMPPGATRSAFRVDDPDARPGNGHADRRRPRVDLVRRQIRRALALRLSVHRIEPGSRKRLSQFVNLDVGQRGGGVRDVAQMRKRGGRQILLKNQRGDRRDKRKPRDALAGDGLEDRARIHGGLLQHDGRARPERGRDLAEAVGERQRQHIKDHIVGRDLEVLANGIRCGQQVAMREHDALRHAGRTRCVHERGEIVLAVPGWRRGARTVGRVTRRKQPDVAQRHGGTAGGNQCRCAAVGKES